VSVSREWSRSIGGAAWKNGRRRPAVSWPDWMPRDRWPGSRLALLAALVLVALLTGCSSGQPPRGISGWAAIDVQGTGHYALDPTVGRTNTDPGDAVVLGDNVISGYAYDANQNPLAGASIYIQVMPESSGEVYQTTTGSDGSYSYSVPEGAYLIAAEYGGTSLAPVGSDGSVSVPPSTEVNFQLSS
jgi:Carboxypeptidase regulatory-like domain